MHQAEGKIHKIAEKKRKERDQYFLIQTKQASSISFYLWLFLIC